MIRRRVRVDVLLGVVVVILVLGAVLLEQGTAGSETGAPSTAARPAAVSFAQGYLSYLDGRLPARALPDASSKVKLVAAGAPPIPAGDQQGPLRLTGVRMTYVKGATSAEAVVMDRDRTHFYGFEIDLGFVGGRWQVVYLIPPDLSTILAAPYHPPPAPPAVRLAAERFALAYADYREGATRTPPGGLPTITQQLAAGQDPLAGAAPTHARAVLESITLGPVDGDAASAAIVLKDASRHLRFDFDLERSSGRWQAWGFPEAG